METFIIEPYHKMPNYFLTMSQTARVLGNKDYRVAEKLINKGLVKTYSIPGSKRILLKYHEVMSLPQKEKRN